MRIFIGDIQGCLAELERLLERVQFNPEKDELHPVGGCVWGRQLTAWIAEEGRIVQVQAKRIYSATSLPE